MHTKYLSWLKECAHHINKKYKLPIHTRKVLDYFGIKLIKEIKNNSRYKKGALYTDADGQYIVSLFRNTKNPKPLSTDERFTIAHEIGHILLKEKFTWTPDSKDEYRIKEDYCNIFAASLLVPERAINLFEYGNGKNAFKSLKKVRQKCNVSYEVSARRISNTFSHIVYVHGTKTRNSNNKIVVKINWSSSDIEKYPLNRHKHLCKKHEIGRLLLANNAHGNRTESSPPIGPSFIKWSGDDVCAALVYQSQLTSESPGPDSN